MIRTGTKMTKPSWQLNFPVSAIVFDCEGTLTTLEGINFLAKNNGVGDLIHALTTETMATAGLNPAFYQQRLDLVLPRREQVYALGHQYFAHQSTHTAEVIQLLQRLNKTIYLLSAGINPAVKMFGELLQIPAENVYAVDLRFDQQGNFLRYDESSPLVENHGKQSIIKSLKEKHEHIIQIGNGLTDLAARDLVTRFIGYASANKTSPIADRCEFYIKTPSLAAMLPLVLTTEEQASLNPQEQLLFNQGLSAIQQGDVQIQNESKAGIMPTLSESLQFE